MHFEELWRVDSEVRDRAGTHRRIPEQFDRREPRLEGADAGDELDSLTFVFTGSLAVSRDDAQALVEAHGANATGGVSGNTDYLVAGDNAGQRKQDDADANSVPILSERDFAELLADYGIAWPPAS